MTNNVGNPFLCDGWFIYLYYEPTQKYIEPQTERRLSTEKGRKKETETRLCIMDKYKYHLKPDLLTWEQLRIYYVK